MRMSLSENVMLAKGSSPVVVLEAPLPGLVVPCPMILTLMAALLAMATLVASLVALRPKAAEETILPEMVEIPEEDTGDLKKLTTMQCLTATTGSLVGSNYYLLSFLPVHLQSYCFILFCFTLSFEVSYWLCRPPLNPHSLRLLCVYMALVDAPRTRAVYACHNVLIG